MKDDPKKGAHSSISTGECVVLQVIAPEHKRWCEPTRAFNALLHEENSSITKKSLSLLMGRKENSRFVYSYIMVNLESLVLMEKGHIWWNI